MKAIIELANVTKETKKGNHRVSISKKYNENYSLEIIGKAFFFYDTIICSTDEVKRTFSIDASYGTQSTTRACNAYKKHFLALGYTETENA
ncbi:hypothetical protein BSK59_15605 [Paenibacillus odorifer]|uniref:hypothetical protein n=1 Tax=Paenibacillus odorifer TaxID=189426 RepID=UPI00096C72A5|nr:hypothetical protein [Paenibacillus odorifer]OME54005.1 hypothetical protein BSK59_15605 [Paenibacillus odorifer]